MRPTFEIERRLREERGARWVIGVDEVGVAPYAGPLVAGAVAFVRKVDWAGLVDDSKRLTPARRERVAALVRRDAVWAVGVATVAEIDERGLTRAKVLAMRRAYRACLAQLPPGTVGAIVDDERLAAHAPVNEPAVYLNHGDGVSLSVAAASVVAKVARDAYMRGLAAIYPHYDFERNYGYGTPRHEAALRERGPTPDHRRRFRPVRHLTEAWLASMDPGEHV
ncbi:MAG: ribonuclease HII [Armatimonadota bacterium]|nr:ribonuclease HII [Armatimonadota bacterium]